MTFRVLHRSGSVLPFTSARTTHRQQALSWELRAATSLACLLGQEGQPADAIACVEPVYGRFTEGFDTADLIAQSGSWTIPIATESDLSAQHFGAAR